LIVPKVWNTKINRIRFLFTQGLNTPVFFEIDSEESLAKALIALPGDRASIRTYIEGEETNRVSPFHPFIPKDEARDKCLMLLKTGQYKIMLSEGVDLQQNEISAISKVEYHRIYTEYCLGPGTIRRITEGKVTPKKLDYRLGDPLPDDARIRKALAAMVPLRCNEILFEWSWNSVPVGVLKQNLIFWEFINEGVSAEFEGFSMR
jgi:hypothetical protein